MEFIGIQKTFHFIQTNMANREEIFPLLCPIREADWIDGWEYNMIHSKSGLIEKNCVFSTPNHGNLETIWQVIHYNKDTYSIEFVRVTPRETIVKISIQLESISNFKTRSIISYQYTGLNESQNKKIESSLEEEFIASMNYWENALNHYLKTGKKLLKNQAYYLKS
ncbi:hypothetical protein [Tamlana flava]|uniref:hypothetical protein n=1 Tax=Tamlana flava TaxID=3158572 RepID=UPI00351BD27D